MCRASAWMEHSATLRIRSWASVALIPSPRARGRGGHRREDGDQQVHDRPAAHLHRRRVRHRRPHDADRLRPQCGQGRAAVPPAGSTSATCTSAAASGSATARASCAAWAWAATASWERRVVARSFQRHSDRRRAAACCACASRLDALGVAGSSERNSSSTRSASTPGCAGRCSRRAPSLCRSTAASAAASLACLEALARSGRGRASPWTADRWPAARAAPAARANTSPPRRLRLSGARP